MQYFRRVIVPRRALRRGEMGPLVWSGQLRVHEDVKPGDTYVVDWCVVFWFWVPPGKREPRNLKTTPTKVTDPKPFELLALAEGELEEEWFNQTFPGGMPMEARSAYLIGLWQKRCFERLGFIPDATGVGAGAAGRTDVSDRALAGR